MKQKLAIKWKVFNGKSKDYLLLTYSDLWISFYLDGTRQNMFDPTSKQQKTSGREICHWSLCHFFPWDAKYTMT